MSIFGRLFQGSRAPRQPEGGGDLFDKGPANLPLLDALQAFRRLGLRFTLLCGNHDVRTFLGLRHAESQDVRLAHLFVRMGQKTVTLFKEVFDAWTHEVQRSHPRITAHLPAHGSALLVIH